MVKTKRMTLEDHEKKKKQHAVPKLKEAHNKVPTRKKILEFIGLWKI